MNIVSQIVRISDDQFQLIFDGSFRLNLSENLKEKL